MKYCKEKLDTSAKEIIFVAFSDHMIRPVDKFHELIKASEKAASSDSIITLGITPDKPVTGYGYINAVADGMSYKVLAFKGKT